MSDIKKFAKSFTFASFFTFLLIAINTLLIILPDNNYKLYIGIGSLVIFFLSWVITIIYWRKSTEPVRAAVTLVKVCQAKFKGAKDKIAECMMK